MMNRYRNGFDLMGSHGFPHGDFSPYRHTPGRDDVTQRSFNRPGGCGCGSSNGHGQSRRTEEGTSRTPICQAPTPIPERSTCGCEGLGAFSRCKKLMEQIRAVDFALYETVLYLDVYPHSCDALETYRKLKARSEALHAEYEASHGPLTAFGNRGDSWDWMSKPFPWEFDAE